MGQSSDAAPSHALAGLASLAAGSSSPDDGVRGRVTTTVDLILLSASRRRLRLLAPPLPLPLGALPPPVALAAVLPAPLLVADAFLLLGDGERLSDSLASCLWRTLCRKSFWAASRSVLGSLEEEVVEEDGGYASCWYRHLVP